MAAETFQFDLVSPERRLASVAARRVQVPGIEGEFTAMPNHAPFLTPLRPGIVRVEAEGEVAEYVVTGGFAEVTPEAASVLAELAVPRAEVTGDFLADLEAKAEAALAEASEQGRAAASQRLGDLRTLRRQLGH